jgi:hypothetical protein
MHPQQSYATITRPANSLARPACVHQDMVGKTSARHGGEKSASLTKWAMTNFDFFGA